MTGINKQILLQLFDEINGVVNEDENGNLSILQPADENFPYDVLTFITVNNNILCYFSAAPDFKPNGNLLEIANEFNMRYTLPKAVVREGDIRMEVQFLLDEEVSKEYVVENCIKYPICSIWSAFLNIYRMTQ